MGKKPHHRSLQEQGKLFKRRGRNKTHLRQERAFWAAAAAVGAYSPARPPAAGQRSRRAPGSCASQGAPYQFCQPCLSRTAGHSSSPSRQVFFLLRSPGSMLALGCLTWHHDLLSPPRPLLPENSKALLQCGLQGGTAKLRSAGRASQGPFQKFVAVCERLGKERWGQPRLSKLHSWKWGSNRKTKRRVLCFESERRGL